MTEAFDARAIKACEANYTAGSDRWVVVDDRTYWWFLESVPPLHMGSRGYVAGEPWSHDDRGQPVSLAVRKHRHGYEARLMPLDAARQVI